MGTSARLIPMLRAVRSMRSSSFFGKRSLMRLYPGRNRTKMAPSMFLIIIRAEFSGIVNTVSAVAVARMIVIQYHVVSPVFRYSLNFGGVCVDGSFSVILPWLSSCSICCIIVCSEIKMVSNFVRSISCFTLVGFFVCTSFISV